MDTYNDYPHEKYPGQLKVGYHPGTDPIIFVAAIKGSPYIVLETDPNDGESLVAIHMTTTEALSVASTIIDSVRRSLDSIDINTEDDDELYEDDGYDLRE